MWGKDDKPKPDEDKPWNKFPDAETAKKIAEGAAKKDPPEKDQTNPPKKG